MEGKTALVSDWQAGRQRLFCHGRKSVRVEVCSVPSGGQLVGSPAGRHLLAGCCSPPVPAARHLDPLASPGPAFLPLSLVLPSFCPCAASLLAWLVGHNCVAARTQGFLKSCFPGGWFVSRASVLCVSRSLPSSAILPATPRATSASMSRPTTASRTPCCSPATHS